MELALWIVAGWLGLSVVTAFAVIAFIRINRGGAGFPEFLAYAPVPVAVTRQDRAAPRP